MTRPDHDHTGGVVEAAEASPAPSIVGGPNAVSCILIRYGLTTTVLGERFEAFADKRGHPQHVRDAWWQRTDHSVTCTACPNWASVNHPTLDAAKRHADKHAADHRGPFLPYSGRIRTRPTTDPHGKEP